MSEKVRVTNFPEAQAYNRDEAWECIAWYTNTTPFWIFRRK